MKFWEKIVKERYCISDKEKTIEDVAKRNAWYLSQGESDAFRSELEELIASRKFIPGGRILRNAGTPYPMLINCSVIGSKDSREAIGETLKQVLVLGSTGCGIGIPGDSWRPKNASVRSLGHKSCGVVGWFKAIDAIAVAIAHGSDRRLALMFSLSVYHPDIMEFIDAKNDDLSAFSHANMSVSIDNNFIYAVENDLEIELSFAGVVYEKVKARLIWDKIILNAWKTGEPGILNIELANKMSNTWYCSRLITTNPCFHENAVVKTKDGLKCVGDLNIGDEIWSKEEWTKVINKVDQGKKKVLYAGNPLGHIILTKQHKVVEDGEKVELESAVKIDSLLGPMPDVTEKIQIQDIINGILSGNGKWYKRDQYDIIGVPCAIIRQKDIHDFHAKFKHHFLSKYYKDVAEKNPQFIFLKGTLTENEVGGDRVPDKYLFGTNKEIRGYLHGVFSAWGDYNVMQERFIYRRPLKVDFLFDLQLLLNSIGITSYIEQDGVAKNLEGKTEYSLNIAGADLKRFITVVGFVNEEKTNFILNMMNPEVEQRSYSLPINKVEIEEEQQVYDITVDNSTNTLWANGFDVSNCGEQWLGDKEICDLGSIVLDRFYVPALKENQKYPIDYVALNNTVTIAVRTLDNVIDLGKFPIPDMEYMSSQTRRIGLGAMGYHSFLMLAGIKMSSEDGIEFFEHISETISHMAYRASIELAKEKGPFPLFDKGKYLMSDYVQKLPQDIRDGIAQYGIRNACLTTIPPHGTTGLVAESSTSCEPIYSPWYKRLRRVDGELVEEYLEDLSFSRIREIEYDNVTKSVEASKDISIDVQLEIQKRLSRVIDAGISKTINIANDVTPEELSEKILKYARYIKGITVYRRGARFNEPYQEITEEEYKRHTQDVVSEEDQLNALKGVYKCSNGTCDI